MKRVILVLLIFCATSYGQSINFRNFKVVEEAGKNYSRGTRFDFNFEIQGDYSYSKNRAHQIDLYVYKGSIDRSNLIAVSFWNREDDRDIIYSSYTKVPWWNISNISYSTNSGSKFYLVVKYAGLTKTLSYTFQNSSQGNPDLKLNKFDVNVFSDCFSCNSNLEFHELFDGSKNYLLAGTSGIISGFFTISNVGTANAKASKVKVYLSQNSIIDANDFVVQTISIGSISQRSSALVDFVVFGSNLFNINFDPWSSRSNGIYYIIMQLDADNVLNEKGGENNNILVIPFEYNSDPGQTSKTNKIDNLILDDISAESIPYEVKVYNTLGKKVLTKTINSKKELKQYLPKGIYYINSKDKNEKILVE